MYSQRYSCDRCRQQKVRCLKNWELSTVVAGSGNHLTPCERCTKADVACVYSLRQKNRRSKGADTAPSPRGTSQLSQDFSSVLSSRDIAGYELNDLMMSSLDTTMACIDDGDAYSWSDTPDLQFSKDGDDRTRNGIGASATTSLDAGKETLTAQLMKLSDRAVGAARELECAVITTPLTVNSSVVNEAFEATNTLVRIVNSIPLGNSTHDYSQPLSSERQVPIEYSLIFQALAAHQHVLALFRAICDSIKRSLGSILQEAELHQQSLHGAGSSSAQFIMVLQLIMHLVNRIGRSLGIGSRRSIDQSMLTSQADGGEEIGSLQGIINSAQIMLRTLPDEHVGLSEVIQKLHICIEEGAQV
ncbi:hypothetical protein FB567DRAFT_63113 [Paraphoma chrysanthemicola]|uniref:Zn(2)-C6 fungal-type domain-containing protein n=1 Tax=Paraphoma chrysanthemicola TaxID=798071 RepID=A0A8K0R633_9PLEO|nr:hypothetical protein FB567DRAFT_63113 [Paraphoma chrysanthemicola]